MKNIEYNELKQNIKDGILRHHKDDFIGILFLKGRVSVYDQKCFTNYDTLLDSMLDQIIYNIIINLKIQFNESLVITQEGVEIMQKYCK